MNEKIRWGIAGFVLGGLVVYGAIKIFADPPEDEDRPPIIVKNGSLIFENEAAVQRSNGSNQSQANGNRSTRKASR